MGISQIGLREQLWMLRLQDPQNIPSAKRSKVEQFVSAVLSKDYTPYTALAFRSLQIYPEWLKNPSRISAIFQKAVSLYSQASNHKNAFLRSTITTLLDPLFSLDNLAAQTLATCAAYHSDLDILNAVLKRFPQLIDIRDQSGLSLLDILCLETPSFRAINFIQTHPDALKIRGREGGSALTIALSNKEWLLAQLIDRLNPSLKSEQHNGAYPFEVLFDLPRGELDDKSTPKDLYAFVPPGLQGEKLMRFLVWLDNPVWLEQRLPKDLDIRTLPKLIVQSPRDEDDDENEYSFMSFALFNSPHIVNWVISKQLPYDQEQALLDAASSPSLEAILTDIEKRGGLEVFLRQHLNTLIHLLSVNPNCIPLLLKRGVPISLIKEALFQVRNPQQALTCLAQHLPKEELRNLVLTPLNGQTLASLIVERAPDCLRENSGEARGLQFLLENGFTDWIRGPNGELDQPLFQTLIRNGYYHLTLLYLAALEKSGLRLENLSPLPPELLFQDDWLQTSKCRIVVKLVDLGYPLSHLQPHLNTALLESYDLRRSKAPPENLLARNALLQKVLQQEGVSAFFQRFEPSKLISLIQMGHIKYVQTLLIHCTSNIEDFHRLFQQTTPEGLSPFGELCLRKEGQALQLFLAKGACPQGFWRGYPGLSGHLLGSKLDTNLLYELFKRILNESTSEEKSSLDCSFLLDPRFQTLLPSDLSLTCVDPTGKQKTVQLHRAFLDQKPFLANLLKETSTFLSLSIPSMDIAEEWIRYLYGAPPKITADTFKSWAKIAREQNDRQLHLHLDAWLNLYPWWAALWKKHL